MIVNLEVKVNIIWAVLHHMYFIWGLPFLQVCIFAISIMILFLENNKHYISKLDNSNSFNYLIFNETYTHFCFIWCSKPTYIVILKTKTVFLKEVLNKAPFILSKYYKILRTIITI